MTGQGQVREVVRATVLLWDDVLNVEAKERIGLLKKAAVLAAVFRAGADPSPRGRIDHEDGWRARSFRAFACRIAMNRLART